MFEAPLLAAMSNLTTSMIAAHESHSRTARAMSRSMLLRMSGLSNVASQTMGDGGVVIVLIDGTPQSDHPCLSQVNVMSLTSTGELPDGGAAAHATFLASMFVGNGGPALGLCRKCSLVMVAAIDGPMLGGKLPIPAIAERLATAVMVALRHGADVIVLPLDVAPGPREEWGKLTQALGEAARQGVRTIISAGNEVGPASSILSAPGVVPVTAIAGAGSGMSRRWGSAVARWGLAAPARGIPGADAAGGYTVRSGSSFAAAFVAAAFALLRSLRPMVAREALWWALLDPAAQERAFGRTPTLDADRALQILASLHA